jgi:hypothetical protein
MTKTKDRQKVAVSTKALIARINRKLAIRGGEVLKAARSERARIDLGDFYIVCTEIGGVNASHLDLEELGREIGALKAWEVVR